MNTRQIVFASITIAVFSIGVLWTSAEVRIPPTTSLPELPQRPSALPVEDTSEGPAEKTMGEEEDESGEETDIEPQPTVRPTRTTRSFEPSVQRQEEVDERTERSSVEQEQPEGERRGLWRPAVPTQEG